MTFEEFKKLHKDSNSDLIDAAFDGEDVEDNEELRALSKKFLDIQEELRDYLGDRGVRVKLN